MTVSSHEVWYELPENAVPILAYHIAIGEPVLDNIPQAEQGQQTESGIRRRHVRIPGFVREIRVTDSALDCHGSSRSPAEGERQSAAQRGDRMVPGPRGYQAIPLSRVRLLLDLEIEEWPA